MNFTKGTANIINLEAQAAMLNNDAKGLNSVPPKVLNSINLQNMNNNSPFSPGMPLNPTNPIGTEPRQMEYRIGQNIVQRPRASEKISFDTIRNIIESYDIAQMCIEVRQDELRDLEWDIVPANEEDTEAADKYESEIKEVKQFFEKPDGYNPFDDFQNKLAYDWLTYDALCIYPHLNKGGKLVALEPVDGTSITPMIDYNGRIPESPAPAFVQWMYGLPWVWLDRDHLIYRPHRLRNNKIYGFPAVEWLMLNINVDIRYQAYFLEYFTDGSIPDTWINAPTEMVDPQRIKEFQDLYDSVMVGDQTQKCKAKFIPAGSQVTQAKDTTFDINFPKFLMQKTCAAFKVQPAEIGFTENVNKSSGDTQENTQYRRSIKPSAQYFSSIYTDIIHKYFGYTNLKFKFLNVEEQEDMLLMAQRDDIYIKNGTVSPDEVRTQRLGLDVNNSQPVPRGFYSTRDGFVPLEDAIEKSKLAIEQIKNGTIQAGQDPNQDVNTNGNKDTAAEKSIKDFFINPTIKRKN